MSQMCSPMVLVGRSMSLRKRHIIQSLLLIIHNKN